MFIEEPFWTVDTLFYTKITKKVMPLFFFFLSKIIPFDLLQESTAVPSMTQEKLNNVFFSLPDLAEQAKILEHIITQTEHIDEIKLCAQSQIKKLKEYRQSIISEAVTGQVDVRDWVELKT
jgi:type I restriction enzyme S subunit